MRNSPLCRQTSEAAMYAPHASAMELLWGYLPTAPFQGPHVCQLCGPRGQAAQHRKDTEAHRLQATVQSAREALQSADESRLSLQFKCGELAVALEDVTQEKNRLHGLLQREREEVGLGTHTPWEPLSPNLIPLAEPRRVWVFFRPAPSSDRSCEGHGGPARRASRIC